MPNWCSNSLTITGDEKLLTRFLSENAFLEDDGKVIPGTIDFSRSVPPPDPKPADFDWYWWNVRHWGTKWNNSKDEQILDRDSPTHASGGLNTAWAPPKAWVTAVARKYQGLRFVLEYEEPGMDFAGRFVAEYVTENGGYFYTNEEEWSPYELVWENCCAFFEKYVQEHASDFDLNRFRSDFETEFEKVMKKHGSLMFSQMDNEVENLCFKCVDEEDMQNEFSDWLQNYVNEKVPVKKVESIDVPEGLESPKKKRIKVNFIAD